MKIKHVSPREVSASKDSRLDGTETDSCQKKWGTLGYTPKLPLTSVLTPLVMERKKDPGTRPSCIHMLAFLDPVCRGFWKYSLSPPFLRKVH